MTNQDLFVPRRVDNKPTSPVPLPAVDLGPVYDPAGYLPDEGLADAVNVALLLGLPLLLAGEPGTGKSQLASVIAWQLGLEPPLVYETKSTSTAQDLFYWFDNLGRFHAVQRGDKNLDSRLFLKLNALGAAVVYANDPTDVSDFTPPDFVHSRRKRSVVLIDEIDKAPRDFPNDILNEIERLYFRVPEVSNRRIVATEEFRPIVVITSNSEKALPDAFLRRCVFYYIPFPSEDRLEEIVLARLGTTFSKDGPCLREAVEFLVEARDEGSRMRKPPGTAELLNWLTAMSHFGVDSAQPLRAQTGPASRTLSTLSKHTEDQARILEIFKSWVHGGDQRSHR
jgi:MoxR-like ATPase